VKEEEDVYQFDEQFRDSLATVDERGKRIWIYPKRPSGRFHGYRIAVTIFLLSVFFAGPWIRIGGQPLLLINVLERKFVVLGQVFWPQDFILLAIVLITFFVFVILFTVAFGRVWCGWMCPQTLFMEMVFRKIEYWIEGDAPAQRRLDKEPYHTKKIFKKTAKHTIFILISLLISHTAMAYLIGSQQTLDIVSHSPGGHLGGFIGLVAFTGVFYFVFAKFREQACIAVCPYGRLQGVLLGKESIVVAYDWLRGEPRSHLRKSDPTAVKAGDCVDCKLCVHVCPTGIDIRNGTQLECVNCTACIDACDEVMVKVGRPTGLIRYASYNGIKDSVQKIFTPRVMGYSLVLIGLLSVLGFTLARRTDVETTIFKVPGTLFQRTDDGGITNLYNVEFVNKTFDEITLEAKVESPRSASLQKADGKPIIIPAESVVKDIFFVKIPAVDITSARVVVVLGIYRDGKLISHVKAKFIGPVRSARDRDRHIDEDNEKEDEEH
jgi:cytochrome c oxidase accessory protein FixG